MKNVTVEEKDIDEWKKQKTWELVCSHSIIKPTFKVSQEKREGHLVSETKTYNLLTPSYESYQLLDLGG